MHTRRKFLIAAVAVILFLVAGPLAERVVPMRDSAWSVIVPWIIILAVWAFIGPKLWRDWRDWRDRLNSPRR